MKRIAVIGAVVLAVPALAAPAAMAKSNTVIADDITANCVAKISSKMTAAKSIKSVLSAKDVVTSMEQFIKCSNANKVVTKAAKKGLEKPFNSSGFRCTPTVAADNVTVKYACKLTGADNPTSATLEFTVVFKG
jgi:hypothetical protein